MEPITIHPFTAADVAAFNELQQCYAAAYPGAPVLPGEAYLAPAWQDGQNLMCAGGAGGELLAYAAFYPQGELAWVEVRALPGSEAAAALKDRLYAWLVERARQTGLRRLAFQYTPQEEEPIAYAQSKGARRTWGIYSMARPLDLPIPACPPPDGFTIRRWRMESEAEQRAYLAARNECLPESHTSLEDWQYFAGSPWFADGVCVAGFAGETLAGGVTVFWEPGSPRGSTEYVFTRPPYRGRGLARALLAESLRYLKEHGLQYAILDVKAENRTALGLYTGLGYTIAGESAVYEVELEHGSTN